MLGPNMRVIQPFGFFLRETEHSTRPLRKPFHAFICHGIDLRRFTEF